MAFRVLLTDDAARDLEEIISYISEHDSPKNASHVLKKIEDVFSSMTETPGRGSYPKELSSLGIKEYRELFFKPYRIIYRVLGNNIYVYMIADGRRDMQALLSRRLLNP